MAKMITYSDKQAMGTQPTIPDVNKITDSDMNEIKNGINGGTDYSGAEERCGTWFDGKPIYRKVINTGQLPNSSVKFVAHNISNFKRATKIYGVAYASSTGNNIPLPYPSNSNVAQSITIYSDSINTAIVTAVDHRLFGESYVILEYTKTTD